MKISNQNYDNQIKCMTCQIKVPNCLFKRLYLLDLINHALPWMI